MSEREPTDEPLEPFARPSAFRAVLGYAAIFGAVGAVAGLVFLWVTGVGDFWGDEDATEWFGGHVWWVAVTAGAGLVVGLLRRGFHMPSRQPGLIEEASEAEVEPARVPSTVAVSAVSLIGGASLGPEAALGSMGGGFATWLSRRRGLDEEMTKTNTLNGMSGAFGGLLSAPFLAAMLVIDLARPGGDRLVRVVIGGAVAASISFAIYFPIAGTLFLEAYALPSYEYEDWNLLAGVALGVVAAGLALLLGLTIGITRKLLAPLEQRTVLRPVVGGVIFGLVAVALPLTLFTGSDQLATVIEESAELGTPLLIALVLGKILTFAVCVNTGFIGGPLFPAFFIGGTAGIAASEIVPGLPPALAFTCLLAAVPAAVVPAPFTMVLLAGLLVGVGVLQFSPILISVVLAYILVSGTGVLQALARRAQQADA
ncbi:MAG: chloride channel protein [Miltoncostaeaceae bacterium]